MKSEINEYNALCDSLITMISSYFSLKILFIVEKFKLSQM